MMRWEETTDEQRHAWWEASKRQFAESGFDSVRGIMENAGVPGEFVFELKWWASDKGYNFRDLPKTARLLSQEDDEV